MVLKHVASHRPTKDDAGFRAAVEQAKLSLSEGGYVHVKTLSDREEIIRLKQWQQHSHRCLSRWCRRQDHRRRTKSESAKGQRYITRTFKYNKTALSFQSFSYIIIGSYCSYKLVSSYTNLRSNNPCFTRAKSQPSRTLAVYLRLRTKAPRCTPRYLHAICALERVSCTRLHGWWWARIPIL